MQMMNCPHCGIANSTKRDYCYQCNKDLRAQPGAEPSLDYLTKCGDCRQAGIFPPVGSRIGPEEVWCMQKEEAVPSAQMAGDCFEEAFGWKREDILD